MLILNAHTGAATRTDLQNFNLVRRVNILNLDLIKLLSDKIGSNAVSFPEGHPAFDAACLQLRSQAIFEP